MKTTTLAVCNETELCRIERDNFSVGDFNIQTDSDLVWIGEQKVGEQPKQHIALPRNVFNKLVKQYFKSQPLTKEPYESYHAKE